ncbi:MAG: radical SAM protein, partial [Myxococcota bacterium]
LVQPPLDLSRDFVDYPYHCDLSVVQAAARLRAAGLAARVVDAFALPESGIYEAGSGRLMLGAPIEALAAAMAKCVSGRFAAEMVVVGYAPFNRPPARDPLLAELLTELRSLFPAAPVLLADLYQGGQHYIAAEGEQILASYPQVDALLQHEAEDLLPELCLEMIESGRQEERWARSGGEIEELGVLPVPAWDLIDLEARDSCMERIVHGLGRGRWAFPIDGRTLPAVTSRGCPYACAHCSSNPGRGDGPKRQRRMKRDEVRALVRELSVRFGATRIHFLDEMANVEPRHLDALLESMADTETAYDFPNGLRIDHLRDEQLDEMAGRVCTLSVSLESGVQRVVDEVVEKRLDLAVVEDRLGAAKERSIPTMIHYIIGMPGETAAEINATLRRALDSYERHGAVPAVQYATPLPGTRLSATAGLPAPKDHDWCPTFQKRPLTSGEGFGPEELRCFKRTFDRRLAAMDTPEKLILNLTYRCNNHCVFCAVGNRSKLDGSFERQKEILQAHFGMGTRQLDLDGGEPTLHPRLLELVGFARRLGYERINVTTNGRRCAYSSYARSLVRSGISTMLFSLHGADARTHGELVRVEEAFDQTVAGIRNCTRHRPKGVELGLNVTITNANQDQISAIARLAADLGLAWINLQFLTPFGRATKEAAPDIERATRAVAGVIEEWGERMKIQVVNLPFCRMPEHEEYLAGDLLKSRRRMVFVDNKQVNLHDYLLSRRRYEEQCESCPYRLFCGGFYELDEVPEEPYPIAPEDVDRS